MFKKSNRDDAFQFENFQNQIINNYNKYDEKFSRSAENIKSGRKTEDGWDLMTDAVITRSGRVIMHTPPINSG